MRRLFLAALLALLPAVAQAASGMVGLQFFSAHGTANYTPTAGTTSVLVVACGAGGGSSGISSPGGSQVSEGTPGGGGGCAMKYMTSGFSGTSYTIGTGGGGGGSGANAGSTGGDTTFSTITGSGGIGTVNGQNAVSGDFATKINGGGAASGGDLNIPGGGSVGVRFTNNGGTIANLRSGIPGRSWLGGVSSTPASFDNSGAFTSASSAGADCGEGGLNPIAANAGAAQAGAAGADGCIAFFEFGAGLNGITFVTTNGATTHTPTAGTTRELVFLCGAGGGGAGVASSAGTLLGGSGGGGACAIKLMTTGFSGATLTIGAGGLAGSSGDNFGGDGGSSTFNGVTATGGPKGATKGLAFLPPTAGAAVATGGDFNMSGGTAGAGFITPLPAGFGSAPGGSLLSVPPGSNQLAGSTAHTGNTGVGCGGGGEGANDISATTARAGGAGADGCAIIFQFK